jgi:hypothetical protein
MQNVINVIRIGFYQEFSSHCKESVKNIVATKQVEGIQ